MPHKDPIKAAAAKRRHYEKNKEAINLRSKQRAQRIRKEIQDIKEASLCADCKRQYPYFIMHFDHLGLEPKVGNIGKLISHRGESVVMAEIEKCEVVCANCHSARSWARMQKCWLESCDKMANLVVIDFLDKYPFCGEEHRWIGE